MIVDVRRDPVTAALYRAFLNGVDVSDRCFYANEETGEVRLYKFDSAGLHVFDVDRLGPAEETLYGLVRIVRRRDG